MGTPEQVRGNLDMLLLAIVADAPVHGYAALEELRRRSDAAFDLPEGTVYPALHRLEAAGLLASSWDKTSARKRRVYTITKRGPVGADREASRVGRVRHRGPGSARGAPWPMPA